MTEKARETGTKGEKSGRDKSRPHPGSPTLCQVGPGHSAFFLPVHHGRLFREREFSVKRITASRDNDTASVGS